MQLRRLELTNIRSYPAARLDLGPGTTLLSGDVGAGKTSLLYAIEMALFGVAEVEAGYLVRHGASRADVSVRFEDAEHRYEVARSFRRVRRRGREAFEPERIAFLEDGRSTTYSATEIRRRVIELLGFPDNPNPQARSDLWRWAIYVPQEQMRAILAARPEDRLETVRKALGVERYRLAADNAELLAYDLKVGARHYREEAGRLSHWEPELDSATREADRLRASRAELERSRDERLAKLEGARGRVEELEGKAQGAEAARREAEGLERERLREETALADRQRLRADRRAELERVQAVHAEAAGAADELDRLVRSYTRAEEEHLAKRGALEAQAEGLRRLAAARAELAAAERLEGERRAEAARRRAERETAGHELESALAEGPAREPPAPTPSSLEEIDARLDASRTEERTASERAATARRALEQVDELLGAGVCPTCHQTVEPEEFRRHRTEAAEEALVAEAARRSLHDRLGRLEEERKSRERYERAHERWREADRRRSALGEAARRAEEAVRVGDLADAEAHAAHRRAADSVRALAGLDEADAHLRADLRLAEAALEGARVAVDRARLARERRLGAEASLAALGAEIERTEREISLAEARQAERQARLRSVRQEIASAESLSTELIRARADLRGQEEALAGLREALARLEAELAAEARRIAAAEEGRARAAALLAAAQDLEARAAWATGPFRLHVLTMERRILARAQGIFEREFARYFASLVDDSGLVARTDSGFTPEVAIDGEPTPAEALSGGERTSLALAFRLALATVVRTLGNVRLESLLLDEPTDGFSSEQVVRMGELLEELGLPQVIVVSHEAQLASIADRVVRVRKDGGRSSLETGDGPPAEASEEAPVEGARERARPARGRPAR